MPWVKEVGLHENGRLELTLDDGSVQTKTVESFESELQRLCTMPEFEKLDDLLPNGQPLILHVTYACRQQ